MKNKKLILKRVIIFTLIAVVGIFVLISTSIKNGTSAIEETLNVALDAVAILFALVASFGGTVLIINQIKDLKECISQKNEYVRSKKDFKSDYNICSFHNQNIKEAIKALILAIVIIVILYSLCILSFLLKYMYNL